MFVNLTEKYLKNKTDLYKVLVKFFIVILQWLIPIIVLLSFRNFCEVREFFINILKVIIIVFVVMIIIFVVFIFSFIAIDEIIIEYLKEFIKKFEIEEGNEFVGVIWGLNMFALLYGIIQGIMEGILVGILIGVGTGILMGITIGFLIKYIEGTLFGIITGVFVSLVFGILFGIDVGIVSGILVGIIVGAIFILLYGILMVYSYRVEVNIGNGIIFGSLVGVILGIMFGIVNGSLVGIILFLGYNITYFRIYNYIFVLIFYISPNLYKIHPVYWDSMCIIPFIGLNKVLVECYSQKPEFIFREVNRLIVSYPSQKYEALKALTIIVARNSVKVNDLSKLNNILNQLPEGEKNYLSQTSIIKEIGNEISSQQMKIDNHERPLYKHRYIIKLEDIISNFKHNVALYEKPLSNEFVVSAGNWLKIVLKQKEEVENIIKKELTQQIFRAGDPIEKDKEAFLKREKVIAEIDKYAMIKTGCPGILLYGRRRVGKSTIIKNLKDFLPDNVLCIGISMQKPKYFTSMNKHFLKNLINKICRELVNSKIIDKDKLNFDIDNLEKFYEILELFNKNLNREKNNLIIMIDEYEMIDEKIGEKVFNVNLLDTFRESIQSHRNITWIFVGNHDITELNNADWSSYFISLQTVNVPMFSLSETQLLLTKPLENSKFKDLIKYDSSIWCEGTIDIIHKETGGWPHLIQLIAEICITNLNESDCTCIDNNMLNIAIDEAVVKGKNVLTHLLIKECSVDGEWDYLSNFSISEKQEPPKDSEIRRLLKLRELVKIKDDMWELRVPLMRKFLIKYH